MKIAVDCYEVTEGLTGVGRVIHNILLSLCNRESHDFLAYTRQKIKDFSKCTNIKQVILPEDKGYFRWQNGAFFRELKEKNPDLLIAPNYTLPFFFKSKSILFEHDVSFASHPDWFPKRERLKRKYLVKRSLRKASLIMTLSEFSKKEIVRCFSMSPNKIKVIYLGIGERFKPAKEEEILKWKKEKGLKGRKIIGYLGSIFNRRNIPLLVESVRLLRKEFPEVILYVVGKDLTYPPQDIKEILNENWIIWEESIPESELPVYLSSLDVFSYLSEYEGFGLPPLESLACGTIPVLLRKSALSEVYPDFSIMVKNPDIEEVRDHLKQALTDKEKVNSRLSAFNIKRVYFSWNRVAEEFKTYISEAGSEG
ncbi:MAG: glycosyltransferase family 1 protein [Candidatus Aminicenantes bacterium]